MARALDPPLESKITDRIRLALVRLDVIEETLGDEPGVASPGLDDGTAASSEGRSIDRAPRSRHAVWMAESIQKFKPAARVKVQNSSTRRGIVREPSTTPSLASSTV